MLDGLLSRGFAGKCKSLIKMVKTRVDVIRRKRNATQKFLKKDMADLLANGLDVNAYGRADALLVELDLSSCYDFVEKSCEFVAKHLSVMQKQSECPEECREAVSSLMFAAARFSDLPELRELRQIFQEKYGNSLDYYANKEFVEKLTSRPSTLERRVRLMRDIASEYSISWDANAFEWNMSKPVPQEKPRTYGSLCSHDDRSRSQNGKANIPAADKSSDSAKERKGLPGHKPELFNGVKGTYTKGTEAAFQPREEANVDAYTPHNRWKEINLKTDGNGVSSHRKQEGTAVKIERRNGEDETAQRTVLSGSSSQGKRQELNNVQYKEHYERKNIIPARGTDSILPKTEPNNTSHGSKAKSPSDGNDISSYGLNNCGQNNTVNSTGNIQEEERDKLKSFYNSAIPPPYVKPHTKARDRKYGVDLASTPAGYDVNTVPRDTSNGDRPGNLHKVGEGHLEHPTNEGQSVRSVISQREERNHHLEIEVNEEPIPRPRSHRRRHSKLRSHHDEAGNNEDMGDGHLEHPTNEGQAVRSLAAISHEEERNHRHEIEVSEEPPIPRPRSHRRRHSKLRSHHDEAGNNEDMEVPRKSRSKRRDGSRQEGLHQVLFDDGHHQKDEEERMIDKLLIHYSKKPSTFDPAMVKRKSRTQHAHDQAGTGASDFHHNRNKDSPDEQLEAAPVPVRSISLPNENNAPTESKKTFNRAASFQPDRPARHVHPKLPDYDDLAARFAALKGR